MKNASDPTPSYQRKKDEAKRLRVTVRSIDNWMAAGRIPYIKLGRVVLFDPAQVDEALKRFQHNAR